MSKALEESTKYKFRIVPNKLLSDVSIHFIDCAQRDDFYKDLIEALSELNLIIKIISDEEGRFRDDLKYEINSIVGKFYLENSFSYNETNIWSEENSNCILEIDRILSTHAKFVKIEFKNLS